MKVDAPRFNNRDRAVWCEDCPFSDDEGYVHMEDLCNQNPCPTADTYAASCELVGV